MINYSEKPDLDLYNPKTYFNVHNAPFDVASCTHYVCESGSHAYGTNTPNSDLDLRGVVFSPLDFVIGLNGFEQISNTETVEGQLFKNDACFYSFKRFVEICYKNGSHALEMLYCDPAHIHYISPIMNEFLTHKDIFLSNLIKNSFGYYAYNQLITMLTKKTNNTGRIELLAKHSYDPKLFQHSIRLYRMASECLLTGELNVLRPDAKELLEIRNGKYSFEEAAIFEYKTNSSGKKRPVLIGGFAFEEEQKFIEACNKSILPEHPNFNKINNLLIKIQKEYYGIK